MQIEVTFHIQMFASIQKSFYVTFTGPDSDQSVLSCILDQLQLSQLCVFLESKMLEAL